jgi:hypothetical protein
MIQSIMRWLSGPYLNKAIDFYIIYQDIFNTIVVILGFLWILYSKNKKTTNNRRGINVKN